jgi:hypothetical protein
LASPSQGSVYCRAPNPEEQAYPHKSACGREENGRAAGDVEVIRRSKKAVKKRKQEKNGVR